MGYCSKLKDINNYDIGGGKRNCNNGHHIKNNNKCVEFQVPTVLRVFF